MDFMFMIQKAAVWAIPVIFAITIHEAAHAWVAMLLGDKTAYRLGRVTFNPMPHIDPIGTVALPIICLVTGMPMFGWAKPVPVEVGQLRFGRKSFVWVALAGPFSNMIMAITWAIIAKIASHGFVSSYLGEPLYLMGMAGVQINMALMIFNLLPLPPLDGSRVVARFLKGKALDSWHNMERYGMFILMALMMIPGLLNLWFGPMMSLFSWIPRLSQ